MGSGILQLDIAASDSSLVTALQLWHSAIGRAGETANLLALTLLLFMGTSANLTYMSSLHCIVIERIKLVSLRT